MVRELRQGEALVQRQKARIRRYLAKWGCHAVPWGDPDPTGNSQNNDPSGLELPKQRTGIAPAVQNLQHDQHLSPSDTVAAVRNGHRHKHVGNSAD